VVIFLLITLVLFVQCAGLRQTYEDGLVWNASGVEYYNRGDYANAIKCFLQAKNIFERTAGKRHPNYATSVNNLGLLYFSISDYARAERYYLESASITEEVLGKDHPNYAISLNNLGRLYDDMGDYTRAERYYLESASIIEKAHGKEHPSYAVSLNNLGGLYNNMGDYTMAERCLLEAASIREKTLGKDHQFYAISLNDLGLLYMTMGDYVRAERYYLDALSIYEKTLGKNHPYYATSLNGLGLLYKNKGDYEKAERCYLEAMSIRERMLGKNHPSYATSLNNLGSLFSNKGDFARAERYFLEATSISERVHGRNHPDYATSLNNLGALYFNMHDYIKAERYYLDAASIWEKTLGKNHPYYITSLDNLYALYLAKKEYNKAIILKKETSQLNKDQVNKNFSFLSERQRNAYWNRNVLLFESTYSLSLYHPVPDSNILNYDNALFAKGLLLRTNNTIRDSIYASGNQRLINQFEELGSLRQQISNLRQSSGNDEYVQTLEQQAEALDKSLTRSSSAFRNFQADLALNWRNVRDSLRSNEAAIEFVSFRIYDQRWTNTTQYAALILRPGMNAPQWIPLCEENTLADIFKQLDGKRVHEQPRILYDEQGAALYTAIWQPLEKALEGVTTVYYSPSGLLHKVAFNAIPAGGGKRLMDIYNLNLVSTTREVVYLRTRTALAPNSAVVYGGLLYNTDAISMIREAQVYTRSGAVQTRDLAIDSDTSVDFWDYLQYTEAESRAIERLLNASRIPLTLFNGSRGNKESFKALSGNKTTVIHLATHGFFNHDLDRNYEEQQRLQQISQQTAFRPSDNPLRRSGLILSGANTWARNPVEGAQNGVLLAEEVAGLNLLGTELVVLSACETALGVVDNSEGVFGLQRAFKLAGAQTLIMSLWKVDDEATSILIGAFYENWLAGKTKQDAFKEAQRKMRADARYASPFYWAAFVLMD